MNELALTLALLASVRGEVQEPKFFPDDPLLVDNDRLDVPVQPETIALSDLYDRFGHMFKDWGKSPVGSEAANVNVLDEAPNSSWFTNRLGERRMSVEELARGANQGSGPDPQETWTVFLGKSQGLTPGFEITDGAGDRYVIKLDPVEVPEVASAAEVIASKLFHALGYNVPENYIVRAHPDRFRIAPGTEVEDRFGDKMPLTEFRFRRMIRRVPRLPDGTMRVLASKYIPGRPIGPFRYYGTRSDDPNDVIPHEDRRELRGLRLFAAWLNHDDTRAHNTQDSYVEDNGTHYVRHFLLDFGSTFGSGSVDMQYAHLSFHYSLDLRLAKKNFVGFGFHVPEYRKAKWPRFPEYEAVGRWESELFDPEKWRNDYPNPAFVRMTARDAFWAAKILMTLTREELSAIVETGEYSRPEDAAYFLEVLVERQLKCGRFGINALNPLDEFRIEGDGLAFTNLSEKYGFVQTETSYEVDWSSYDNATGESRTLVEPARQTSTRLALPSISVPSLFLVATIRSHNSENPHWARSVQVYLRPEGSAYAIVGIDRESPEPSSFPME
ncbi:MAG TPA: hypothetical protein VLK65_19345 [Vicinamibacteria bacterium]|nr:hypothetical protein [Vicinamibacteria bacterium]